MPLTHRVTATTKDVPQGAWRVPRADGAVRPSLLAVTSELPWPLHSGGHLRTYHLLRALARRWEVRLVAPVTDRAVPDVGALEQAGIAVRTITAGPRRWWREAARALGAAADREPYVMYRRHRWQAMRRVLSAELRRRPPEVLYLDHLDSIQYGGFGQGIPIVVDMHNVYSVLVARESQARRWPVRTYLAREARLLQRAERCAAEGADALLAVSTADADVFRQFGAQNVHLVSNGVDYARYAKLPTGRADAPPNVLYMGALSWQPNVAAARFLAEDVLPRVRAVTPEAKLQIVGRSPTREARALGALPGVEVIGGVADVRPYLEAARALAVPLEVGGGSRLKIVEAFAAGLPVVTTLVGCEGLDVQHGEHLWISSRDDFAGGLTTLLTDGSLGVQLALRARGLAQRVYAWGVVGEAAHQAVASAVGRIKQTATAGTA